jgi:predicted PurR-regulated permease PerM
MSPADAPDVPPIPPLRDRALGIIATATLLALLYFGRDVLVPVTLAFILSLLIAPLVRALRHLGLGQTTSVLAAVFVLALSFGAIGGVIGSQLVNMAASLPGYERTLELKLETLDRLTMRRVNTFTAEAGRALNRNREPAPQQALQPDIAAQTPIPVELHEAPANSWQVLQRVLGSIWVPIEMAGIVLVVLVFVLLEQEALRDRFIRIVGGTNIRLTTLVINDAGERLSRFFVSQFAVNFSVGALIWVGLSAIGLPHPLVWAALSTLLRFVPYVGIWIAALCSAVLGAAVDVGWSTAISTLSLFVLVELVASQLVEPQLYGHTTGLSPLSVVIAAIFWSWLWGPIGLILSTPLTLCLLVAGRHIKALSVLDILLGDTQALTMPQRFYQRALSADADELIARAREFLKRDTFANYCDLVLLPALHLARLDLESGAISREQQMRVRAAMVAVIAAIGGDKRGLSRRRLRTSVLDQSTAGRLLRQQREQVSGRWQGPLEVPPGSVIVCVSMGSMSDDLAAELLVRILREQKMDARHMSIEDTEAAPPPNAAEAVSIVYMVSAFPSEERNLGDAIAEKLRQEFPSACIVAVFLPGMLLREDEAGAGPTIPGADKAAGSLGHAVQICLDMQRKAAEAKKLQ